MPKKKAPKKMRGLVKQGAPLPSDRKYKFDSAYLKARQADNRTHELLDKNFDTKTVHLPRQYLIFKHKPLRITPKSPRIS